jgi:hypothetical protein
MFFCTDIQDKTGADAAGSLSQTKEGAVGRGGVPYEVVAPWVAVYLLNQQKPSAVFLFLLCGLPHKF